MEGLPLGLTLVCFFTSAALSVVLFRLSKRTFALLNPSILAAGLFVRGLIFDVAQKRSLSCQLSLSSWLQLN